MGMIPEPPLHGFLERCGTVTQSMYYFNDNHGSVRPRVRTGFLFICLFIYLLMLFCFLTNIMIRTSFGITHGCENCSFPSLINSNIISGWVAHYDNVEENNKNKFDSPKYTIPPISPITIPKHYSRLSSAVSVMSQSLKPIASRVSSLGYRLRKSNPTFKQGRDAFDILNTTSMMGGVCKFS
jgi:hypothetical protein